MLQRAGGEAVVAQEQVGKCSGGRAPEGAVNPVILQASPTHLNYELCGHFGLEALI